MRRPGLLVIVAVLTALMGLLGEAGLAALTRTEAWRSRLASEMTAAIRSGGSANSDAEARRAVEVLAATEGVAEVRLLDVDKVANLLSPWTAGARSQDLSVLPRLVAVELDPRKPAARQDLEDALRSAGVDAVVDDHSGWRRLGGDVQTKITIGVLAGLLLCVTGLAATGILAADREAERRRAEMRVRVQLGDAPLTFLTLLMTPIALNLLVGMILGALATAGLGYATGAAPFPTLPAEAAEFAIPMAGLIGTAGLVTLTSAFARAAWRVRELGV
ncbi:MAG: hypothetical protein ACKOD3_12385 [Phenylobacterium sp.]